MPRTIHASTEALLDDPTTTNGYFLTLHFDPVLRISSLPYDKDYDGNTYTTSRQLRKVGDVSESAELRVGSTTFEFGGADQTFVSLILNNDHIGIQVEYWRVLLNATQDIVGDHISVFEGEISGANLERRGNEAFVVIECASHWANWSAKAGRYSNDNSQQAVFSGDTCARLAPDTVKNVPWGRKA